VVYIFVIKPVSEVAIFVVSDKKTNHRKLTFVFIVTGWEVCSINYFMK
jgi:hypothetical protein